MSIHQHPSSFRGNVTPVNPTVDRAFDIVLRLASAKPIDQVDDLARLAKEFATIRDRIDDMLNDIAFLMRARGTDDFDIKRHMQNTCPMLAAMYRAEAIAADRIECDTTAWAKLAAIRDLMVQGIEERMPDREFDNPVYPSRDRPVSSKKRWARIAAKHKNT